MQVIPTIGTRTLFRGGECLYTVTGYEEYHSAISNTSMHEVTYLGDSSSFIFMVRNAEMTDEFTESVRHHMLKVWGSISKEPFQRPIITWYSETVAVFGMYGVVIPLVHLESFLDSIRQMGFGTTDTTFETVDVIPSMNMILTTPEGPVQLSNVVTTATPMNYNSFVAANPNYSPNCVYPQQVDTLARISLSPAIPVMDVKFVEGAFAIDYYAEIDYEKALTFILKALLAIPSEKFTPLMAAKFKLAAQTAVSFSPQVALHGVSLYPHYKCKSSSELLVLFDLHYANHVPKEAQQNMPRVYHSSWRGIAKILQEQEPEEYNKWITNMVHSAIYGPGAQGQDPVTIIARLIRAYFWADSIVVPIDDKGTTRSTPKFLLMTRNCQLTPLTSNFSSAMKAIASFCTHANIEIPTAVQSQMKKAPPANFVFSICESMPVDNIMAKLGSNRDVLAFNSECVLEREGTIFKVRQAHLDDCILSTVPLSTSEIPIIAPREEEEHDVEIAMNHPEYEVAFQAFCRVMDRRHNAAQWRYLHLWLSKTFTGENALEFVLCNIAAALFGKIGKFIFMLKSRGDSGKTKLSTLFSNVLGQLYTSMNASALSIANDQCTGPQPELAKLEGKTFIGIPECNGLRIAGNIFKVLCGDDIVSYRMLNSNPREFCVNAFILMMFNTDPVFNNIDRAIVRRVVVIESSLEFCSREYIDSAIQNGYDTSSMMERIEDLDVRQYDAPMLSLILFMYRFRSKFMTLPQEIKKSTNEFWMRQNDVYRFALTKLRPNTPGAKAVTTKYLHSVYSAWAAEENVCPEGLSKFSRLINTILDFAGEGEKQCFPNLQII